MSEPFHLTHLRGHLQQRLKEAQDEWKAVKKANELQVAVGHAQQMLKVFNEAAVLSASIQGIEACLKQQLAGDVE